MVNKHTILGRVGKDPEVKTVKDKSVANFSVATSTKWRDQKGDVQERTEWHNIVAWGKLADICSKYVSKGDLIFLEGEARSRSYEKDGVTRYVHEVYAETIKLMPKAKGEPKAEKPAPKPVEKPDPFDAPIDDDLPF